MKTNRVENRRFDRACGYYQIVFLSRPSRSIHRLCPCSAYCENQNKNGNIRLFLICKVMIVAVTPSIFQSENLRKLVTLLCSTVAFGWTSVLSHLHIQFADVGSNKICGQLHENPCTDEARHRLWSANGRGYLLFRYVIYLFCRDRSCFHTLDQICFQW